MALSTSSKAFLVVLAVAAGVGAGAFYTFLGDSGTAEETVAEGQPISVEVPEGVAAVEVGELLEDAGVIDSALAFRVSARFDERANQIHPNTYELRAGMSADEILAILSVPPEGAEVFTVTIPEGLTVDQTLARLAEAGPHSLAEYEQALSGVAVPEWIPAGELPEGAVPFEGLLFPDTYEFRVEDTPQMILAGLVEQTENVVSQATPPEGFDNYDLLTIASLIERETRVADEQPIVASVIYNRLATPMRLQIDATVQYARGEHTNQVLFTDLEIQSLWNTYEVDGLPPTPIAAAGAGAIQAAGNPADTEFLFYVLNNLETGEHAFATTNDEHNANVAVYRQLLAEAEAEAEAEGGDG